MMVKRRGGDAGPEWGFKQKRDKFINVAMTETQQEAIKTAAAAVRMTASTWMLEQALAALPKSEAKKWEVQ